MELQLRMPAVRIQFVFLQQTAAGRRKIAEAEQEQLTGSGSSGHRRIHVRIGKRKDLNLKVTTFYFYTLVKTMVFT